MSTVAIYRKQIEEMTPYHDIHDLFYQDTPSGQVIRYTHLVLGRTAFVSRTARILWGMDSTTCGDQTLCI
jgi:hypothetical protein